MAGVLATLCDHVAQDCPQHRRRYGIRVRTSVGSPSKGHPDPLADRSSLLLRAPEATRRGGHGRPLATSDLPSFRSERRYAGRSCESPVTARRRPAGRTDQLVRAVAYRGGCLTPPAGSDAVSSETNSRRACGRQAGMTLVRVRFLLTRAAPPGTMQSCAVERVRTNHPRCGGARCEQPYATSPSA